MTKPVLAADTDRDARRQAARARLRLVGDGFCPALLEEAEASLTNAFALSDLLFNGMHDGKG